MGGRADSAPETPCLPTNLVPPPYCVIFALNTLGLTAKITCAMKSPHTCRDLSEIYLDDTLQWVGWDIDSTCVNELRKRIMRVMLGSPMSKSYFEVLRTMRCVGLRHIAYTIDGHTVSLRWDNVTTL